jgi:hypothetical protein
MDGSSVTSMPVLMREKEQQTGAGVLGITQEPSKVHV